MSVILVYWIMNISNNVYIQINKYIPISKRK